MRKLITLCLFLILFFVFSTNSHSFIAAAAGGAAAAMSNNSKYSNPEQISNTEFDIIYVVNTCHDIFNDVSRVYAVKIREGTFSTKCVSFKEFYDGENITPISIVFDPYKMTITIYGQKKEKIKGSISLIGKTNLS